MKIDTEGRIKVGSILTPDFDASLAAYDQYLRYRPIDDGIVDAAWAEAMGAPAMAGKRYATLAPESGTSIYIRFFEGTQVAAYQPLRSYGWGSLEITIKDVWKLADELENSPFEMYGPPKELEFSDAFIPMQVIGPSGEVLYLNQVNSSMPGMHLPLAQSYVDHIFITPLATPDMDAAVDFYAKAFGWDKGELYEAPYTVISKAFGKPMDTLYKFQMTQKGEVLNNEVDQYPEGTIDRPATDGELPPGVSMVSFITESLDKVAADPLCEPFIRSEAPYQGRRAAYYKGAAGELIEAIELS
ncbi:MAG: VOC family protein [Sphingomonadales bacterium]